MFKFLRKYNTYILAVGGTLLMIVFLIPQAIQSLSQQDARRRASIATVGQDRVSLPEWEQVRRELAVVRQLEPLGGGVPILGSIETPEHWYLLVREAASMGLVRADGSLANQADLAAFAAATQSSPALVERTLSKIGAINQMIAIYMARGEFSDRRLRREAVELFRSIDLVPVTIQATADADVPDPTEAELVAHVAEYDDVLPGEGAMGFGYRLPDRLILEWLEIDPDAVRAAIVGDGELDELELRVHWRAVQGTGGLPTIASLGEGADVPDAVREDFIDTRLQDRLDDIRRFAQERIRRPQRELDRRDGYLELPEDWADRRVDLAELASEIASNFDVPRPIRRTSGDQLEPVESIAATPGLGTATNDEYGAPTTIGQMLASTKEFGGDGDFPIQEAVAGPILRGTDGTLYVFRLVEVDASRPPGGVDEVRDQAVRDLRRLAHYRRLESSLDSIREQAIREGLLAVAVEYGGTLHPRVEVARCDPRIRQGILGGQFGLLVQPTSLPVIGVNEDVVDEIMNESAGIRPNATVSSLPLEVRTVAVAADDALTVLVGRVENQTPMATEDYEQLTAMGQLQGLVLNDELDNADQIREAFDFETLAERHRFELKTASADDDAEDEAAEPAEDVATES